MGNNFWTIILFIVFIVAVGVVVLVTVLLTIKDKKKKEIENREIERKKQLEENQWTLEKENIVLRCNKIVGYEISIPRYRHSYMIDKNNYVGILSNINGKITHNKINFNDIVDCKIIQIDKESGVATAFTGALLAGTAGAIVGSQLKTKFISNYKIHIITKNIVNPLVEILLIDYDVAVWHPVYKQADDFATKVYASVMAIIANNQK